MKKILGQIIKILIIGLVPLFFLMINGLYYEAITSVFIMYFSYEAITKILKQD